MTARIVTTIIDVLASLTLIVLGTVIVMMLSGCAVPIKPRIYTLDGRTGEFFASAKVPVDLSGGNGASAN